MIRRATADDPGRVDLLIKAHPAGVKAMRRTGFTFEGNMRHCRKREAIPVACHGCATLAPEWHSLRS